MCLFSAAQDGLRIYGWEPCRILDCVPLPWGRIQDMAVTSSQLVYNILFIHIFYKHLFAEELISFAVSRLQIGVSYNVSNVSIYVVDLKKVAPFGGATTASLSNDEPFRLGQSFRKSFNKEKPVGNRKTEIKINEESDDKSSTETEDDAISTADIKDLNNYHTIFQPRGRECEFLIAILNYPFYHDIMNYFFFFFLILFD